MKEFARISVDTLNRWIEKLRYIENIYESQDATELLTEMQIAVKADDSPEALPEEPEPVPVAKCG